MAGLRAYRVRYRVCGSASQEVATLYAKSGDLAVELLQEREPRLGAILDVSDGGRVTGPGEQGDRRDRLLERIMGLDPALWPVVEGFIEGVIEWGNAKETMTPSEYQAGIRAMTASSLAIAGCVGDRFGRKE